MWYEFEISYERGSVYVRFSCHIRILIQTVFGRGHNNHMCILNDCETPFRYLSRLRFPNLQGCNLHPCREYNS